MKGELIKHSGSLAVFSHFALENYFDIKTDQNDGYYVESGSMITSNKNKSIKYYIRKELLDGSDLGTKYANIPITFYYLEIKHTDNTDIENEEILTFNLTAPKNADVPKIEKEKNLQNTIEVLNKKIISSSSNSILFNRIKKISEMAINMMQEEMIFIRL
ncbi:hypothetical protein OFR28_08720 [Brachyspira hyodysenteriae]|nr:hypothetical protein [Brachyspira hyodysenteriae]